VEEETSAAAVLEEAKAVTVDTSPRVQHSNPGVLEVQSVILVAQVLLVKTDTQLLAAVQVVVAHTQPHGMAVVNQGAVAVVAYFLGLAVLVA
jgi:hypothetical protein